MLHPADWQKIALSSVSSGAAMYAYQASGAGMPAVQAPRQLWGLPVLVSGTVAAGTGILGDFAGGPKLFSDGQGVRLDWSENVGSEFKRHKLPWRCEGRFDLGVPQPQAFVKVALTSA